jgi:16S rRNA processing protein RimM
MRLVAVGRILKPQGRRGEVKLLALTDDPGRFEDLEALYVLETGERRGVEAFWRHADGAPVLKLEGINDITAAEALRGKLVGLPEEALRPLPDSRYYWWSLVGCKVVTESGLPLGIVEDVQENPAHDFLVVRDGDRETLIPFIREIVTAVSPQAERIVIRPPQGLLEL